MKLFSQVRTLVSSVVTLGVALSLVSLSMPIAQTHAAAPDSDSIIINEINWAGSPVNAQDQWVELYNPSAEAVNFTLTPYTLSNNGVTMAEIKSGMIMPGGYYVISRLTPAQSTLVSSSLVAPTLVLSSTSAHYKLTDENDMVVDHADDGSGAVLAGQDNDAGRVTASMARRSHPSDGSQAASWFTSHSTGSGLETAQLQYGTPGGANIEINAPTEVTVSPLTPTSNMPVVKGKALTPLVTVRFTKLSDGSYAEQTVAVSAVDQSFSATSAPLAPGLYRMSVRALSAAAFGVYSAEVVAPTGSAQNVYVVSPATAIIAAPTLGSYPTIVATPSVTLSGIVEDGASVVVSVNGQHYAKDDLDGGRTFSLTINLVPNTVNQIELRAQDANGNTSAPTIATVTHDSIAPAAIPSDKLTLQANPSGTNDSVTGLVGAAEMGSTVEIYADQALTRKITSAQVAANGSFGPLSIGDNAYATVYVAVRDVAGNLSAPTAMTNGISFAGQNVGVTGSPPNAQATTATVSWQPVPGAVNYVVRYKPVGGSYGQPIYVCSRLECPTHLNLSGLTPGTKYIVAVAAVDQFGNVSEYRETNIETMGGVGGANLPLPGRQVSSTTSSDSGANTGATDRVTQSTPAPTATPTSSPAATDEEGDVKSAEEAGDSRNWTPWIILAVLVGLALLATAGYFYWFGGEAGEAIVAASTPATKNKEEVKEKEVSNPKEKKSGDKEKRW